MTLDLTQIAARIADMVGTLDSERDRRRFSALHEAWHTLDSADVRQRMQAGRTTFLLARCADDYHARYPEPPLPAELTVAASDGSLILPDRHSPARYWLLNIGKVRLRYGRQPDALLTSEADLRFTERDLWLDAGSRRIPANETILGVRRATAELRAALDLLAEVEGRAVALQDGTLVLWSLSGDDEVIKHLLPEYLEALEGFRQRGIPVASYISGPGSTELVNVLRVSICDYPSQGMLVNCQHCRERIWSEDREPYCNILPNVTDRYVLAEVARLQPGERTAVFQSESRILEHYPEDHRICYVYVHVGHEVARVEMPRWVAADLELLDLVHATTLQQCRLGRGYPVVLQEAHEQAVLSQLDRRLVEETIERELARLGIVLVRTGKDQSKRGRFI